MLDPFLSGALLLLLLWSSFRIGRWFCTAYDTSLAHYIVAALMVGAAAYVVMAGQLRFTLWLVSAFAGFYAGLFIGGHQRLWAEEQQQAGVALPGEPYIEREDESRP